jgi:hypothetical protein
MVALTQTIKNGDFSALINANAIYTDGYPIIEKSTLNRGYKNQGADLKASYDLGFRNKLSVRETIRHCRIY